MPSQCSSIGRATNKHYNVMRDINNIQSKNTSFKLSNQVKTILHEKGFSFLFNYQEYERYKRQCKNAFNKAYSIADKFLSNAEAKSDYSQYIF